jgi:hypothetical protein
MVTDQLLAVEVPSDPSTLSAPDAVSEPGVWEMTVAWMGEAGGVKDAADSPRMSH